MNIQLNRKLPVGVQTFEDIRNGNFLYVDKTAMVWEMAHIGKPYFLSRPRRFGKSLLLSTFKSYFEGRKDLFEGLAIEKLETDWAKHPVLHLDLNAEKFDSVERLEILLNFYLTQWEAIYGKGDGEGSPSTRFAGIIRRACEQTGKQVVVLVDEYDKPLTQNLLNAELMDSFRRTLKGFYGVLKSADPYLRFVLLTGVTKFSQVSVFSDLNHLKDISMVSAYATVCGITREELVQTFTPEIDRLSQTMNLPVDETIDTLKSQYDGYHFCEDAPGMFNPFSLLNAFQDLKLNDYWFQTGTPTYLVDLLRQSDYDLRLLVDGVQMGVLGFAEYRADPRNPIPMIYQSGYLTIKDHDKEFDIYTLGFPNNEVQNGFLRFLVPYCSQVTTDETDFHIQRFVQDLRAGRVSGFMERLQAFFADFPYELNDKTERHYQVIFYLVFKLMGQFSEVEVHSAKGRADAVVKTKDYIYVFEFKLNGTAEEALRQIDEKGYLLPYTVDGRTLVKVGVEFDKNERNIGRYLTVGLLH